MAKTDLGIGFVALAGAFIVGYSAIHDQSVAQTVLNRGGSKNEKQNTETVRESVAGLKTGLGSMDGHPVSNWIIPYLQWARKHGWHGVVTSGYRTQSQELTAARHYGLSHYADGNPSNSNHTKINYPGGAVDVTQYEQLAQVLRRYPGGSKLVWGGPVIEDAVHFSSDGH